MLCLCVCVCVRACARMCVYVCVCVCDVLSWQHTEGEQAFGQALWGWCVNMAARIAAVTRHCMNGTEEEFQDVLRSFFVSNLHGNIML